MTNPTVTHTLSSGFWYRPDNVDFVTVRICHIPDFITVRISVNTDFGSASAYGSARGSYTSFDDNVVDKINKKTSRLNLVVFHLRS